VGSVAYGSGVGKERVIRWDLRSQAFGVHASAASFNDLSMASAEMGHLGLGVGIVQAQLVTPVNALMGHLAENIYNMGVANATQGHTVAAPGQTQLQVLPVVAADQGHTATPVVLVKNLPAANASMGHEATPDTLAKIVLAANATQGHTATPVPIGLTVVNVTMGHEGLAVGFGAAAANLTVVAGTMPHTGQGVEGFSPTQLADLKLWLAPESDVTVSAGRVEQWNDKSGLNNHAVQAASAAMPTIVSAFAPLGSFNIARFGLAGGGATIDRQMHATNVAAASAVAASGAGLFSFAAVVHISAGGGGRIWHAGVTAAVGSNNIRVRASAGTSTEFLLLNSDAATTAMSIGQNAGSSNIIRVRGSGGRFVGWLNGVATVTANASAGARAIGATAEMLIGNDGGLTDDFRGYIAEIIVASTVWSSSQGRELDKLLGAKYGIDILWAQPVRMANAEMGHTVAAPEIFSPDSLADLKLWLAPESGVVVSGNRVEQWNDKSGLANHATNSVSASMPYAISALADLNGHNAVRFASTDVGRKLFATNAGAVSAVAASGLSKYSGAIVVEASSIGASMRVLQVGITSAVNSSIRIVAYTAAGKYAITEAVGATTTAQALGSSKLTPVVLRWSWSSGNAAVWENGVQVLTTAKMSAGSNNAIGATPMMIIGAAGNDTALMQGHVAEVIVGSTAWSSAQGRELDKLLGAKYGIAIT
jgi:hypothetical protein